LGDGNEAGTDYFARYERQIDGIYRYGTGIEVKDTEKDGEEGGFAAVMVSGL
jgi:hypothetical protein